LVIVAGPNGAGKTTFAREYLELHPCPYVSADHIAEGMDAESLEEVRLSAGRAFARQALDRVRKRETFLVESTLSGRTVSKLIEEARVANYEIVIMFVFLVSAEACLARIRERVRRGGHLVAEEDVRRRFPRSMRNFWTRYRPLAHRWHLSYNGGAQFQEVAVGEGASIEVRNEELFAIFLRTAEEGTHE